MYCKPYLVALYLRLSKDDGNEESQSIQSQRELLTAFVKKQGWSIADEYVDDGYSGTNFDRPEFKRLIADIEDGKINLVITKDLSRLGRNYIQVGYYTEEFFPMHQIRYIALGDNYDSDKDDGKEFAPFRNIINEMYARDTSKKIRSILDDKAKRGEPRNTVFPIFGYAYNDAHERVPDSETAPIVKLIFKRFLETASTCKTARYLTEHKTITPRYYNAVKYGYNKAKVLAMPEEKLYCWNYRMVNDILSKEEYLGIYRTAKTKSISYKNKKRFDNDGSYVFEGRYEPLIDRESWDMTQKLLKTTRGAKIPIEENGIRGLLICSDCGSKLRIDRTRALQSGNSNYRLCCQNKDCKHRNHIHRRVVEDIIKQELFQLREHILKDEKKFLDFAATFDISGRVFATDIERDLKRAMDKNGEIDIYISKLFEQNAKGILPASTYAMMLNRYTKGKKALEDEIQSLKRKMEQENANPKNYFRAQELVKTLKSIHESELIKAYIAQKIIKEIVVKTRKINNSRKNQEVEITIRYYGCDEIIKGFLTYEGEIENNNICEIIEEG